MVDLEKFRAQLIAAFPPQPFLELVSTHDECDEGIAYRQELPGKSWDQVPAEFVDFYSAAPCLLEPDALVAFLPAWLLRSMETLNEGSVLAEFTLYFLCPGGDDEEGWDETRIAATVKLFDDAQRAAVCVFLQSILESPAFSSHRPYAEFGLRWWREL
jgi:hypothetical protein